MADTLGYATPEYQRAKPSTVGFMLGILGLGLIFLSGCFLIGIMLVQFAHDPNGSPLPGSPSARLFFLLVLYFFAFACFSSGVFVSWIGVRKLVTS